MTAPWLTRSAEQRAGGQAVGEATRDRDLPFDRTSSVRVVPPGRVRRALDPQGRSPGEVAAQVRQLRSAARWRGRPVRVRPARPASRAVRTLDEAEPQRRAAGSHRLPATRPRHPRPRIARRATSAAQGRRARSPPAGVADQQAPRPTRHRRTRGPALHPVPVAWRGGRLGRGPWS